MDIELKFGKYNNFCIDDARISQMLNGNEKSAVQMSVWEKIKDFFRADKKHDAYKALHRLLHPTDCIDKLDAFNKLRDLAIPECQEFFKKEIFHDEVLFFIEGEKVGHSRLQKLMNISEQTHLEIMSKPEQDLFLKILDTLRQEKTGSSDSYSGFIRLKLSDEHGDELLDLYRPQESMDHPGTALVDMDFLDYQEEKLLRYINQTDKVKFINQFSTIGYQNTASGVKFSMLHPSINYLLKGYSQSHHNGESNTDLNSKQIEMYNKVYSDYNDNKTEIDRVLHKIYDAHGGTLNISYAGQNRNCMVTSPYR